MTARSASPMVPSYLLHKPSGRARVRINGRDHYLGRHGTPESREAYRRLVAEYLANGVVADRRRVAAGPGISVAELVLRYWRSRISSGVAERSLRGVDKPSLRRLRRLYGSTPAAEFDPASLRTLQRSCVEEGLSRQYINEKLIPVVRRLFRWAVAEGLVPADTHARLQACRPLQRGEFGARDTVPVRPVDEDTVERTLGELGPVVADMVRVQRLAGMRPGEVCALRWEEVDTTGDVWIYAPERHKTAHQGKKRIIALGPRAQTILMRYRNRPEGRPVFSPREAERLRKAMKRASRQTAVGPSQRRRDAARAAEAASRGRAPSEGYTTDSYARAIRRACERLSIEVWSPNQLRHAAATAVRKAEGLDASWALLGHEKPDTTLIYADARREHAVRVAERYG